jgi:hypothetical protein
VSNILYPVQTVAHLALAVMIAAGAMLSRLAHGNHSFLIALARMDLSLAVALLDISAIFWKCGAFSN